MAPRALLMLTCFSHTAVDVPAPSKENAHGNDKRARRRWTGDIKRKILAATRRPRIRAVSEEPCDVDVEKQRARAPEPKVPEQQATPWREGAPVLQSVKSSSDDGATEAVAAAVDGRRKRKGKGLRVRFDLPPEEITSTAPVELPRFPTGVLGEPPKSFSFSGTEIAAAFLMSVIAEKSGGLDSLELVDRDLVVRWAERKAACSRRLSYLRDYCPFLHGEEEEVEDGEDEESEQKTTTTAALPPAEEPDRAEEVRPVQTGLPFDSPESEAEFVKAIRSRYLPMEDDFLFQCC